MPLTLTATARHDDAAVDLLVEGAEGFPAGATITRVDVNGAAPVRLRPGQVPNAGTLTVTDHEAALIGQARYTVRDNAGATAEATATLVVDRPHLVVPVLPQVRAAVELLLDYDAAWTSTGTTSDVVDRADPLATLGPLGYRRGRLTAWAREHADARAVVDVYAAGEVVHLRQPTHARLDLYHVADRVSARRDGRRWLVDVEFVEVAPPTGPVLGALGWSYAQVSTTASYGVLRGAWATYSALSVGAA